jgi:hypothetical protein
VALRPGHSRRHPAVRYARDWEDLVAVLLDARPMVVSREDADYLEDRGADFAYLYEKDGIVMTVPVN